MFDNIGSKLKLASKIFLIVSIIYIIAATVSDPYEIIDNLPYSIMAYALQIVKYIVISFGIYGFGSIVDDVSAMKKINENNSFRKLNGFSDTEKE